MSVTSEQTKKLIKEFGNDENDSGSSVAQVAIMTERINNITGHLKNNKKDHAGRRGLLSLVSKRRKLLKYIRKNNSSEYLTLIEKLGIRK